MRLLALPLLLLAFVVPGAAWADEQPRCDMPAELITPAEPMPAVAAALAARNTLEILALGSGSTVGEGGGANGPTFAIKTPQASFPYRMTEALQALRPAAQFHLTVAGGRNMSAQSMMPILQQELASHHYDLVLWQTGTVEAVRGLRPDALYGVLEDGVTLIAAAHPDTVLVDPQFSRFLRANTDLAPYESVLDEVADLPDVTLFHRFDLTQTWVTNGQIDLERVDRDQREKTVALLNTCLGRALARYVLAGAAER